MNKFITFEGGEGSGKSTQAKLLEKSFKKLNLKTILTREPGGTDFSEKIRQLILQKNNSKISAESELLLIYASRHEHLEKKIIPNLKKKNVICDRFIHSTICYQIFSNRIPIKKLHILHKNFAYNLFPDITFYIDIDPKVGIERSQVKNKYELKKLNFHKKIRQKYLDLSRRDKNIYTINGNLSLSDVHKEIIDKFNKRNLIKIKLPYSF